MPHNGIHHNYIVYYDDPGNYFFDTTLVLTKGNASPTMRVAERALTVAETMSSPAALASKQHALEYLRIMRALDEKPIYWRHIPIFYDDLPHETDYHRRATNRGDAWWYQKTWGEIKTELLTKIKPEQLYRKNDLLELAKSERKLSLWLDILVTDGMLTKTVMRSGNALIHSYYKTDAAEARYPYAGYALPRERITYTARQYSTWADIAQYVNEHLEHDAWLGIRELRDRLHIGLTTLRSSWLPYLRAHQLVAFEQRHSKHGKELMFVYRKGTA